VYEHKSISYINIYWWNDRIVCRILIEEMDAISRYTSMDRQVNVLFLFILFTVAKILILYVVFTPLSTLMKLDMHKSQ
jgi:hypothetical protein